MPSSNCPICICLSLFPLQLPSSFTEAVSDIQGSLRATILFHKHYNIVMFDLLVQMSVSLCVRWPCHEQAEHDIIFSQTYFSVTIRGNCSRCPSGDLSVLALGRAGCQEPVSPSPGNIEHNYTTTTGRCVTTYASHTPIPSLCGVGTMPGFRG